MKMQWLVLCVVRKGNQLITYFFIVGSLGLFGHICVSPGVLIRSCQVIQSPCSLLVTHLVKIRCGG